MSQASYSDAKKMCNSRQMDLLSIQTPKENSLISSFLSSKGLKYFAQYLLELLTINYE